MPFASPPPVTVIPKLLAAWSLLALSVAIHATGIAVVLRRAIAQPVLAERRIWPVMWLLIRIAWWLIILHLLEIAVWAIFYWWQRCLPDLESALYFSGVTYTTVGYGDLVLPLEWRLLGPVQALTGILMCGLSTGFFFAMVSKIYGTRTEP